MSRAYSNDLRSKVVARYEADNVSQASIAQDFLLSKRTVERYWQRFQQTGSVAPKPRGGGNPPRLDAQALDLVRLLDQKRPEASLEELCLLFDELSQNMPSQQGYQRPIATSVMSRALKKLGLTRKKNRRSPPKETPRKSKSKG